jgi:hypothetical protein
MSKEKASQDKPKDVKFRLNGDVISVRFKPPIPVNKIARAIPRNHFFELPDMAGNKVREARVKRTDYEGQSDARNVISRIEQQIKPWGNTESWKTIVEQSELENDQTVLKWPNSAQHNNKHEDAREEADDAPETELDLEAGDESPSEIADPMLEGTVNFALIKHGKFLVSHFIPPVSCDRFDETIDDEGLHHPADCVMDKGDYEFAVFKTSKFSVEDLETLGAKVGYMAVEASPEEIPYAPVM